MSKVFITDYIKNPNIEKTVLGSLLSPSLTGEVEVLLVWHEHIDKAFIDDHPNIKGVVRYGVGYDNVDVGYANSKGIVVCNTPDYGTDEVSDTAIAMLMSLVRKTDMYNELSKKYYSNWQENTIKKIQRTNHVKVGIIGAGRIGGNVILKCNALKFQTYFYDPYQPRGLEKMLNSNRVDSLEELLEVCNVISVHTPLNKETIGIINEDFISKLKPGSILINTARGKLLSDIDLLYSPLKNGHIDCVGLDVLPEEPPISGKLIEAWRNNEKWLNGRLIINPHTAYFSQQAYKEMREKASLNALRIIEGKVPFNIVN